MNLMRQSRSLKGERKMAAKRARGSMDMCNGPLFSKIILYTIPVILTGILQLLFNAADLLIVGRFCGSVSVAAVGATNSLTALLVNLFIGLSVGAGVTVAQGLGAHDDRRVSATVHTAIPVAIIGGGILSVVGVCFSGQFLRWMDSPPDVLPLSTIYMRIYFAGMIFTMLYNYGAAILRATGDTTRPLAYLALAGVLNVVMNVFFVTVWKMNVAGVALATTLSQGISAVLVLIALMRRTDACKLILKRMKIHGVSLKRMLYIGIPAGIQSSLFAISNVIIQSSINGFGSVVMSGNAAGSTIEGFVYTSMNAFHQAALNFTGQNVGAQKYDRVRKVAGICVGSVAVVGMVLGFTVWVFARPLLSLYITDSEEAIRYGILKLTILCLPYCLAGIMDVLSGAIRGLGVSLQPMIVTILGVCVFRVVWVYTIFQMPQFHSPKWLYLSYPISWIITGIALAITFVILMRKRRRRA